MSPELSSAVIGVVGGALAGGLVSFWLNSVQDRFRVWRVSRKLRFVPQPRAGSRVTARVINDSAFPVHGAVAYLTVQHEFEDVLVPPLHFAAYISPVHMKRVEEDRLCWSSTSPVRNPVAIDIYAGEHQCLDILDLGAARDWIEIPSEAGYSSSQTKNQAEQHGAISSRVFLRAARRYRAYVRIVSGDTRSRIFEVEVDVTDQDRPVKLVEGGSA